MRDEERAREGAGSQAAVSEARPGTIMQYVAVSSAMSCEYENGSGCDRILVQPWYACESASTCCSGGGVSE